MPPHYIIGLDVDGVVADFASAYKALCETLIGKPIPSMDQWDFPQAAGYSDTEVAVVWKFIHQYPEWWDTLVPLETEAAFPGADVYYITARPRVPGTLAITESWLRRHVDPQARVILASDKGAAARALQLTHYVDDRPENLASVKMYNPWTRTFLREQPWNQGMRAWPGTRITALKEVDLWSK